MDEVSFETFLDSHSDRFQHPEKQAKLTIILRDMWKFGQCYPDIDFNGVNVKEVLTKEGRDAYLDISTKDKSHFLFLLGAMSRAFKWGAGKGTPHSPSSTFLELNMPHTSDFNRFWEEHSDRSKVPEADAAMRRLCDRAFHAGANGQEYEATLQRILIRSTEGLATDFEFLVYIHMLDINNVSNAIRRAFDAGRGVTPDTPKTVYEAQEIRPPKKSELDELVLRHQAESRAKEHGSLEGISYPDLFMLIFNSSTDHRYILELARRIDGQLRGHSVHCSGTTYSFMKRPPTVEPCEVCATAMGVKLLLSSVTVPPRDDPKP
ncbi:hypothetical protein LZT27_14410 [Aeromonas veronii]|uniref:hypothetical protein n=1 Tax=Aeromonas veronii TaxID=654 RepID=UPI002363B5CB|nr:hypothetical protein [Aeromonas veronii]MDD1845785.1 hypothetical protein [Aeromonas veronii]